MLRRESRLFPDTLPYSPSWAVSPCISWTKVWNGIAFGSSGPRCQWYSTDGKTTHLLFTHFGSRKGLSWLPGLLEACGIHMHPIFTTAKCNVCWVPHNKQYNITLFLFGPFLIFAFHLVHGVPVYWINPASNYRSLYESWKKSQGWIDWRSKFRLCLCWQGLRPSCT